MHILSKIHPLTFALLLSSLTPLLADWDFPITEIYNHPKWTKQFGELEFNYYFLDGYEHGLLNATHNGHVVYHGQGAAFKILGEDYYPDLPTVYESGDRQYVYLYRRADSANRGDYIIQFQINGSTPNQLVSKYYSQIKDVTVGDKGLPVFERWEASNREQAPLNERLKQQTTPRPEKITMNDLMKVISTLESELKGNFRVIDYSMYLNENGTKMIKATISDSNAASSADKAAHTSFELTGHVRKSVIIDILKLFHSNKSLDSKIMSIYQVDRNKYGITTGYAVGPYSQGGGNRYEVEKAKDKWTAKWVGVWRS